MKSGFLRRAAGVTTIYIGVFLLLVFLQFSRSGGFSFREGRLQVTASYPRGERRVPEAVQVSYAGLRIRVSAAEPAVIQGADGSRRNAVPGLVERRGNGVRIVLEGGAELLVRGVDPGKAGEGFVLQAQPPRGGAASISLAYSLAGRSRVEERKGLLFLDTPAGDWSLGLAPRALREAEGRIVLADRGGVLASLGATKTAAPERQVAQAAQLAPQAPKDREVFLAGLKPWVEKTWAGLSAGRWDAERVAWRDAEGSPRFTESALAVYLAEAYGRGAYEAAAARAQAARRVRAEGLSHFTTPFLGDTIRKMQELEAADLVEVKRLASLVQARDPSLFEKEELLHFLMDRSPYSLAQDALRFAAELDASKLNRRQAIGVLACAAESLSYLKEGENPFLALAPVVDGLVAAVRKTDAGFFLATEEDGSTDLRLSLLAGARFIEYGEAASKPVLVGVGQSLVEGVLALSDERGFVPARAEAKAGELVARSGSIAPEELYGLVAPGPFYPREVSFYGEVAPGVWAWTCAPSLAVAVTPSKYLFTAAYPVGFSHYMAFYGVKPFANIKLYDIDYSPDSQFEDYNVSGYFYRRGANALYLKMKHKSERERIELDF